MRNTIKRENYMSEETKQLEEKLKVLIKEDKLKARAQRITEQIPNELRPYVLEELSRQFATK